MCKLLKYLTFLWMQNKHKLVISQLRFLFHSFLPSLQSSVFPVPWNTLWSVTWRWEKPSSVSRPQRNPSSPEMYEKPLKALELLVARLGVRSGVRPTELGTISLVNSGSMCWRSAGPLWRNKPNTNRLQSNTVRWTRNERAHKVIIFVIASR